jgi:hypothetical protein
VQTRPDAARALWQTPLGVVHSSVVQTRPDAAQALWQTPPGVVHSSVVQTRPDAARALVADTSCSSTHLCSADTSRCISGPVADTSRSSTLLCSADTSRWSSGPCSVDTFRFSTGLYSINIKANDKVIETKRSEIFDNDVSFDIEAKRTRSIVRKFISKRSEHVYIKDFKNRSEANTFDSLKIYIQAKRTCLY